MSTHTYQACAYREAGGWWTIEIPELTSPGPGGSTITATGGAITARGLDQAARELVAVWLDIEIDDVNVDVAVQAPEDVLRLWEQGAATEAEGRAAVERGAALRREAVRKIRAEGYTVEAAAAALGISRQRVQQLAKAS
jgi:hypothetical protein